jgi:nucleoside-diphosphate-sugar epimerase
VAVAFLGAIGNEKTKGRAYHVAGEEWMTWEGYHSGLADAVGAPAPQFVHIPTDLLVRMAPAEANLCEVNFTFNNLFDNGAAHEDLGFRVTIPWKEGARRTIQWLENNGKLERSEDFPFYDRIIDRWREATEPLQALS